VLEELKVLVLEEDRLEELDELEELRLLVLELESVLVEELLELETLLVLEDEILLVLLSSSPAAALNEAITQPHPPDAGLLSIVGAAL
jgi:hypothetical protein